MLITTFQVYKGKPTYLVRVGSGTDADDVYEMDGNPAANGVNMYAGLWGTCKDQVGNPLEHIPAMLVQMWLARCKIIDDDA